MDSSINVSQHQNSNIDYITSDNEDTSNQNTSNIYDDYNQTLDDTDSVYSVATNDEATCLSCYTIEIVMPTNTCPSCGGSSLSRQRGLWRHDETRRERLSIRGEEIEPLILKTIETSNVHNATSKFLSVVAQCYGETTEEEIATYVETRTQKLLIYEITTVQQIITNIVKVQCLLFERVYYVDHAKKTIEFHSVHMTYLERNIILEAATYWLQNEYKLSELWINLHRRTNGAIKKSLKMS